MVYGVATIVFGVSTIVLAHVLALATTGAADTVSMVFRNLIRQLETPDHCAGRMIGVNMVFFMGGPQLGELEAGLVANWLGPVVSVDQRRDWMPGDDGMDQRGHAGTAGIPGSGLRAQGSRLRAHGS